MFAHGYDEVINKRWNGPVCYKCNPCRDPLNCENEDLCPYSHPERSELNDPDIVSGVKNGIEINFFRACHDAMDSDSTLTVARFVQQCRVSKMPIPTCVDTTNPGVRVHRPPLWNKGGSSSASCGKEAQAEPSAASGAVAVVLQNEAVGAPQQRNVQGADVLSNILGDIDGVNVKLNYLMDKDAKHAVMLQEHVSAIEAICDKNKEIVVSLSTLRSSVREIVKDNLEMSELVSVLREEMNAMRMEMRMFRAELDARS